MSAEYNPKHPGLIREIEGYLRQFRVAQPESPRDDQAECRQILSKFGTFRENIARAIRKAPNAERIPIKYADRTLDTVYKITLKPGLELTMNGNPLEEKPDTVRIAYRRQYTFADGCVNPITDVISLFLDGSFVVTVDYHPGTVKTQSYGGSCNEYRLNSQSLDTDLDSGLRAVVRGIETIVGWCFTELDVDRSSQRM